MSSTTPKTCGGAFNCILQVIGYNALFLSFASLADLCRFFFSEMSYFLCKSLLDRSNLRGKKDKLG